MRTQTKPSIRAQLVHLSFVIVVVSIALSLAGTLYFALRSEQTALDNNLLNSASILSQMPMLREALQGAVKQYGCVDDMTVLAVRIENRG